MCVFLLPIWPQGTILSLFLSISYLICASAIWTKRATTNFRKKSENMGNMQAYILISKNYKISQALHKLAKLLYWYYIYIVVSKKLHASFYDHYRQGPPISLMKISIDKRIGISMHFLGKVLDIRLPYIILQECKLSKIFLSFLAHKSDICEFLIFRYYLNFQPQVLCHQIIQYFTKSQKMYLISALKHPWLRLTIHNYSRPISKFQLHMMIYIYIYHHML